MDILWYFFNIGYGYVKTIEDEKVCQTIVFVYMAIFENIIDYLEIYQILDMEIVNLLRLKKCFKMLHLGVDIWIYAYILMYFGYIMDILWYM